MYLKVNYTLHSWSSISRFSVWGIVLYFKELTVEALLWTCSYVFRPQREDDLNILGNIAKDAWVLLVFTDLGVLACLLCGCANEEWKLLTLTTSDPGTWLVQQHYLGKHLTPFITTWWTQWRRKQRRKKPHVNTVSSSSMSNDTSGILRSL